MPMEEVHLSTKTGITRAVACIFVEPVYGIIIETQHSTQFLILNRINKNQQVILVISQDRRILIAKHYDCEGAPNQHTLLHSNSCAVVYKLLIKVTHNPGDKVRTTADISCYSLILETEKYVARLQVNIKIYY